MLAVAVGRLPRRLSDRVKVSDVDVRDEICVGRRVGLCLPRFGQDKTHTDAHGRFERQIGGIGSK